MVPRPGKDSGDIPNEAPFKGRFFLCIVDSYLKMIDTESMRLYDILTEAKFDQKAVAGIGLTRNVKNRKSRLLLLCVGDD